MILRDKILSFFTEASKVATVSGYNRDRLKGSHVNRYLGKEKSQKDIGRGKFKRSKQKSKRKWTNKTAMARQILATRHGILKANRKEDNSFVLRYGDIARLMRQFGYNFNRKNGKWIKGKKKKTQKKSPNTQQNDKPISNDKKEVSTIQPQKTHTIEKKPVEKIDDVVIDKDIKKDAKKQKIDWTKQIPKEKDDTNIPIETYQMALGRLLMYLNGDDGGIGFSKIDTTKTFNISDEIIKNNLENQGYTWNSASKLWVDGDGNFVAKNSFGESFKSICGRALLTSFGEYAALDIYDMDKEEIYGKLNEKGYTWDIEKNKWIEKDKN